MKKAPYRIESPSSAAVFWFSSTLRLEHDVGQDSPWQAFVSFGFMVPPPPPIGPAAGQKPQSHSSWLMLGISARALGTLIPTSLLKDLDMVFTIKQEMDLVMVWPERTLNMQTSNKL